MQRRCRAFDQCCDSARHWRRGTLLFFSARSAVGSPGSIARGLVEAVHHFSPLALLGLPDGLTAGGSARSASFGCSCGHTVRSLCVGRGNMGISPVAIARMDQLICRSPAGERSHHLPGGWRHHRKRRSAGCLSLQAGALASRMAPIESDRQIAVPDLYAESRRRTGWAIDRPRDVLHAGSKGARHRPWRRHRSAAVRERVEATADVHSELRLRRRRTWRHGFRPRRGMPADGAAEYDCRDCLSVQPDVSLPGFRSDDAARAGWAMEYADRSSI